MSDPDKPGGPQRSSRPAAEAKAEEAKKAQAMAQEPTSPGPPPTAAERVAGLEREAQSLSREEHHHLHTPLEQPAARAEPTSESEAYQSLSITLDNLRANSKAFITIRDDQRAVWSEGVGNGLVGLRISSTKDPALLLRNFLVNAQEMYLQTYADCQEILVQVYVRTPQPGLRGRVDLPPGASVTLQSRNDRTSLIGLSSFAVEF